MVEDDETLATKTLRFGLAVYPDESGSNIFMPGANRVCVETMEDMGRMLALLEPVRVRRKLRVEVKLFRENMLVGAIGLATLGLGSQSRKEKVTKRRKKNRSITQRA